MMNSNPTCSFFAGITFILLSNFSFAQTCLPAGFTITSQAQINNFAQNYPNCTEILGDLIIQGNTGIGSVTNLNGLSQITSIGGNLDINSNQSLTNLSGLDNLTSISGNFTIRQNPTLVHLDALNSLVNIGGNLELGSYRIESFDYLFDEGFSSIIREGNSMLSSVAGLSNLGFIGGNLYIMANNMLSSLSGLESVGSIGNDLVIVDCREINNLSGLDGLTTIGGDCTIGSFEQTLSCGIIGGCIYWDITSRGNNKLQDLTGLNNLTSIGGNLTIGNNPQLTSLNELNNLASIGGNFRFYNNNSITNLTGLESLTTIGGGLYMYYYFLEDYDYYENGSEMLYGNNSLVDLTGLDNLNTINGFIDIRYSPLLTSLAALDNLDHTGITRLQLIENDVLTFCNTVSICNYLDNGGPTSIWGNANNCNSKIEIETLCACTNDNILSINNTVIADGIYGAIFEVNSNGTVPATGNVNFKAGQTILLDNSFNVAPNAVFSAEIETCGGQ